MQYTLRTLTKASALAGLALTAYGFISDDLGFIQSAALTVFFFWAHVYAHNEINL